MLNRHTYLLVGLLAAGGTPYLTRSHDEGVGISPESSSEIAATANTDLARSESSAANVPPFEPAPQAASDSAAYVRTASSAPASAAPASANPFGGATTSTLPTSGANDPRQPAPSSRMMLASGADPSSAATPPQSNGGNASTSAAAPDPDRKYPGPSPKNKRIEFAEIFRLDLNSAWLMAHWPRVTTGLTELDWHGYRVSLTTGTREDDVAGALTFYYDKEQVIQKMTFRGKTGDPRKLVWFVTTTYGFAREIIDDPAVQVYRLNKGQKPSELIVRPAIVIRDDAPHERFEVDFVMYR